MTTPPPKNTSWQFYLLQLPLWSALILLVVITLLVVLIRFLVPKIDTLRPQIENWLTAGLPFEVEISHLSGSLFQIDPAIGIEKLTLSKQGQNFLVIEDVYFELDTLASLLAAAPRMKDARLSGLELWLEETSQGWQLNGWEEKNKLSTPAENKGGEVNLQQLVSYAEQLLVQGELSFSDLKFHFIPLENTPLYFSAESMNYRRWSGGRQLSFELEASTPATLPAELVITLEGKEFDAKTSALSAWFNLPLVSLNDFQGLWSSSIREKTKNIQGQLSLEGWLSLDKGKAKVDLQARNIHVIRDELWKVQFDAADLSLQGDLDNWTADWKISRLNASDYFFNQLAGRIGYDQQETYLQIEELKLDPLTQQLIKDTHLPDAVREIIKDLAPGGQLTNVLIRRDSQGEVELQANLQNVRVNAWEGAPLGSGLNGWLQADAAGGQVVFANHSLELGFPELYSLVWDFSSAKGAVRWELEGDDLWVIGEDLAVVLAIDPLATDKVYVSGNFAYFYGPKDQRFYLNLGLLPTEAGAHRQLVPDKLVEPQLLEWLNTALQAGQVHQAGFIYAGSIDDNATFQLVTDFSATDFKFQPDWPGLSQASGQVQVLDGWVKGEVAATSFGESHLNNATFSTFLNKKGEVELQVATQVQAPLEFFPWLVKNSPLQKQVPEPLQEWLYSGQIKGDIHLSIPLSETELEPSVTLHSQISDAQLTLSQVGLNITAINGPLNFTLDKGLESAGLVGKFMSQPVEAAFYTEPENRLVFSAGLAAKDIKTRFNLPEALDFTGITQIEGSLPLAPFGVLDVTSDFRGLAFDSPLPWTKTAEEKRNFSMQLDLSSDALPLRLKLADQLDFFMHLEEPLRGRRLELADKEVVTAVLPEKEGLVASISINQLNAEPVYAWYSELNRSQFSGLLTSAPVHKLQGLNSFNISVVDLYWKDFEVGSLDLSLQNLTDGLKLNFTSAFSEGGVWWPVSPDKPLDIRIKQLYLPQAVISDPKKEGLVSKRAAFTVRPDLLADFNPENLPAAFITVKDLRVGKKRFGDLTVQALPDKKGIKFAPLRLDLEQSSLIARLDWLMSDSGSTSHLEGTLSGENLEPALKALTAENEAPIVSGQHDLAFIADWQGSPLAFNLQKIKADFKLDIKDGHFPQTDSNLSGISQVLGLLNVNTLLRRLRLDFSDVLSKGVSYDTIKGEYQLENGYLSTTEPTRVDSSATRMTLTGKVDLIDETLEQELVIVLPVAQSLPLAAVVAGAPQVGAAIWVVQKVFSNLFDTFSEARYKISGPIHDPKIELQRIF